jgi:hypothetical protein
MCELLFSGGARYLAKVHTFNSRVQKVKKIGKE